MFTDWDFTKGGDIAVQEFTAADYDGVWTSGIDYTVVNAFETVGKDPVPVVGADNNGFVKQLLDGTPGAAVTNPAVIGGVGTAIALQALNGEEPEQTTLLTPEVWDLENNQADARGELLRGPRRHVQLGRHGRGLHHVRAAAAAGLQGPRRVMSPSGGRGAAPAPLDRHSTRDDRPLCSRPRRSAKAFGPVVALRAVDLTVRPGEAHALLGANGAGKSTLVKILTGVLRADAGAIAIHGRAHRAAPAERRPAPRSGAGVPGPGAGARPHGRRRTSA